MPKRFQGKRHGLWAQFDQNERFDPHNEMEKRANRGLAAEQTSHQRRPAQILRRNRPASVFSGKPDQVLLRFTLEDKLIGYGGLVHLNWEDARGEVSFLLESERAKDPNLYLRECKLFMNLLMKCAFLTLNLNKISTEAYSHREFHVRALESSGFTREGILREQTQVRGVWTDAVVASCLKSEYLRRASSGKQ